MKNPKRLSVKRGGCSLQRMVRPHGFLSLKAEMKNGLVTLTASQAAINENSHFEPGGFLTIFAASSTGTNTLLASAPSRLI